MAVDIEMSKCTVLVPGVVQLKGNDNTFYVQCCKTGLWFYCIKGRLDRLTTKYGSLEQVGKGYISRDAKREIREGTKLTKKHIGRKRKNDIADLDDEGNIIEPKWPSLTKTYLPKPGMLFNTPGDHTWGLDRSHQWTRCLRPHGIFTYNGGYCNGCKWYNLCKHPAKNWKKYEDQEPDYDALVKMQDEMGNCIDYFCENEL